MPASPSLRVPADYPSIAAALAAAASVGGTVSLAPGIYREQATVRVPAGVTLEGSGAADTIIESDAHTTLSCADGAVRIADICIRQVSQATLTARPIDVRFRDIWLLDGHARRVPGGQRRQGARIWYRAARSNHT